VSIETIERYIQELEAIKNYPRVKREREELSQKIEELTASLDNALKELSLLKELKAHLDGAEMTLEEARLDFIRAQDAEIEKRAAERFEKLRADYESKMPDLVYQTLRNTLGQPRWPEEIAKLIDTEAKKKADAILREQNNWPLWFKKLYEEEVKKKVGAGLNQEFNTRVETAAMARAWQRLNELTTTEWPAWYRTNVEPKVLELKNEITANALQLLKGPWVLTCDRCGRTYNAEVTAEGIEQLLRSGQVKGTCANPECEDHSLFSTRRHTLQVSLHDLIELRIAAQS
jgi:hypothetical protein